MPKRRSNYIRVPIHFVWTTYERMPTIPENEERRLWRYIEALARKKRCDVLAVGGMPNHIHLLVNMSNTISMADLMKYVKGNSSRFISQELKEGAWFSWQSHYGAKAVCPDALDNTVGYIVNQKAHHAEGTIIAEWEETFLEYDAEDEA